MEDCHNVTRERCKRMILFRWIAVVAMLSGNVLLSERLSAMDVPLFYSAKEIRARIVDEKTGAPIAGAVVVAQWILAVVSGRGPTLHIAEAVTNDKGEFVIAEWGPKARRPLTGLTWKSPQILVFKSGYNPRVLPNAPVKEVARLHPDYKTAKTNAILDGWLWFDGAPKENVQECLWNGLNIDMEPFVGPPDKWIGWLNNFMSDVAEEDGKDLPRLMQILSAERRYFENNRVSRQQEISVRSFFNKIDRMNKNTEAL